MPKKSAIRILEADANKRGDLFGRLVGDVFLALGYGEARLNIHKSGREVDIEAWHRIEPRRVIAECKATQAKIGGDDINKFVGVLDAERRKYGDNVSGYFVSLSGFRETAIEQEKESGGKRMALLDAEKVLDQLVEGHIIASPERAMEKAGRCAADQPDDLVPEAACELLAHDLGWVWAVYFTRNKQRTHFALIHADGESISAKLADAIIQSDTLVKGSLASLTYLPPGLESATDDSSADEARSKYLNYLASECGEILLEGMPADQQVGARSLNLEKIFVPLHLEESPTSQPDSSSLSQLGNEESRSSQPDSSPPSQSGNEEEQQAWLPERQSVGAVLSSSSRLAILAGPGAGKTTLIKRLAVAYGIPERRPLINDELPDRTWLPLFIRCRQLGDLANSPISEVLRSIPGRAEMSDLAGPFEVIVNDALRSGNALLLIDGLDEISEERSRVSFVHQLRTFLATYPSVDVVVTSREAGFRLVGGALASQCKHYRVSDLDDEDIMRLTLAWHREVIGDRASVRDDAEQLAQTILDSDRIRQLAQNPLLLTTLLLVNRWVGRIPTRRSVLYGKAIELLLMTWNVEGFTPVDLEEAIPQLAFIAFTMMRDGEQQISSRRLREVLLQAREQMPEVLGYAKISVPDFINRVELRSSLLVLSGHEVEQGTLTAFYEFKHLTFQEYLTALAIAEGYYPDRNDADTPLTVLQPFLEEEAWKEVIPLVAVLSGRKAQPLVRHLTDLCQQSPSRPVTHERPWPVALLGQCILDEIQIPPNLLEEALESIGRRTSQHWDNLTADLFKGRHLGGPHH